MFGASIPQPTARRNPRYCFRDEAERALWKRGAGGLSLEGVLETLAADLRARGAVGGRRPPSDCRFGGVQSRAG
jgi:hypothetical protein